MKITNSECLEQIREYTGNFGPTVNMDKAFIDALKVKLSEDGSVFRTELNAPEDSVITRKVIGRGGYYFHLTTQNSGVFFIWHDRLTSKFIIWGPEYNAKQARGILSYRIKIVTQRQLQEV